MISRLNSAAQIGRMNRVRKDTPWYLAGGISPSDCVAAYQAKGAASYEASLVNLANPGAYNLTEGNSYPSWDTDAGWKRTAGSQYLKTGIIAVNGMALIARFSDASISNRNHCAGGSARYARGISLIAITDHPHRGYFYGNVGYKSNMPLTSGVMAVTPDVDNLSQAQGYANGNLDLTMSINSDDFDGGEIYVTNNTVDKSGTLTLQAAAIYTVPLTAAQVAALTTAMNAL